MRTKNRACKRHETVDVLGQSSLEDEFVNAWEHSDTDDLGEPGGLVACTHTGIVLHADQTNGKPSL